MEYYFERYQYIIKMNGVVVRTSDSFDAPYGAVIDFLDFAKEHYPDETFERTGLLDGGVCLVNKRPTHTRCGVTTTVRFEIRFYKMVAEPMTCQGFVDNILRVEAEKKARKEDNNMEKFVYIVMKNSDFTEGRGPMHIHKVFRNIENAREYIKKQSGIFDSPQCCHHDVCSKDCEVWNGYDIKIMKFED